MCRLLFEIVVISTLTKDNKEREKKKRRQIKVLIARSPTIKKKPRKEKKTLPDLETRESSHFEPHWTQRF